MLAIIQSKYFVFLSHIKEPKDKNIQNCNFASHTVWVETWSLTLREEHN
jgi:hypothetical protein